MTVATRGKEIQKACAVTPFGPGAWLVPGRVQPFYRVELRGDVARCECGDWTYRQRACRHIKLVWEHLRLAPIAPVPAGPAFDDAPLPDAPPDDLLAVDALEPELEAGPFAVPAPDPPPASPLPPEGVEVRSEVCSAPADPLAQVVEKWRRKKAQLAAAQHEQAA
jgi:SWIM zinc finger